MPRGKPLSEKKVGEYLRFEVWGEPKTGKSSFALTAPTPIDFFAYDVGYEQLVPDLDRMAESGDLPIAEDEWEERKKNIFPVEFPRTLHPAVDPVGAYEEISDILKQMAGDLQDAAQAGLGGCGGTIVLDGGTMLNNDLTFKAQQDMEKMKAQRVFGSPFALRNAYWKSLMDIAKGCGRHLIVIHHDAEVWGKDGPTGERIPAGDKYVEREADVIIQTLKREGETLRDEDGKPLKGPGKSVQREVELVMYIQDCRGNSSLRGQELPWMPFDTLVSLIRSD